MLGVVAAAPAGNSANAADFVKKTYAYKSVDGLDVDRDDDEKPRPVIVWIHGGALINASRLGVPKRLRDLARDEGFALVSLDYRLAPEVKCLRSSRTSTALE